MTLNGITEEEKDMVLSFAKNNMRYRVTAREYYISHPGFMYHIRKIKVKTGFDPEKFYELYQLVQMINEERKNDEREPPQ